MITPEMIDRFTRWDMETAEITHLADIGALELDRSLPKEKRLARVLEKLQNPLFFRCGEMGIGLTFDDGAPPLQEVLTDLLLREKSGL